MKLLFTGRGTSGSWQIRGLQLAKAMGATALPQARDIGPYDMAVIVKRAEPDLVARIHAAGVPLIWDVVDAYPQPIGNTWDRPKCIAWLRQQVRGGPGPVGRLQALQQVIDALAKEGIEASLF